MPISEEEVSRMLEKKTSMITSIAKKKQRQS